MKLALPSWYSSMTPTPRAPCFYLSHRPSNCCCALILCLSAASGQNAANSVALTLRALFPARQTTKRDGTRRIRALPFFAVSPFWRFKRIYVTGWRAYFVWRYACAALLIRGLWTHAPRCSGMVAGHSVSSG